MCYDNCEHFKWNGLSGEGRCISPHAECPGEDEPEMEEQMTPETLYCQTCKTLRPFKDNQCQTCGQVKISQGAP